MYLSLVIPCFNEQQKVEADVQAALTYLRGEDYSFELILVDDGSADDTGLVLDKLERQHGGEVRAISYQPNRGKGYAVRRGMLAAQGQYRMFADAGLCVPFSEIRKGMALLDSGADVAIASRKLAQSCIVQKQAAHRQLGSKLFSMVVRKCMRLRYSDTQCGFKLFTARAASLLFGKASIDGFMFDAEMLINARKQNLIVREFPVEWRADPDSRYRPISGSFRNLLELLRIQLR